MKKILPKKFCLFCLLAGCIISLSSNAQIVYTDIPDVTSSGTYNLDLNNDGTIDFIIAHTSKSVKGSGNCKGQTAINQYIKLTPLNNNQVLDAGTIARRMLSSETIDVSASPWNNTNNQLVISYEWKCTLFCWWDCSYIMLATGTGQWYPQSEDGFLGVRLIYNGHSYFGWLRMSVSNQASGFTIKDYAFNSNPDHGIFAGQTSDTYLGIAPLLFSNGYFCAGNNITVPYLISGTFSTTNVVTAELSDVTGSFANPVVIGSAVSNVSGNINAVIPGLTPTGYGYRIRVTSSNPARISYSTPFNTYVQGGLPDPAIVTWDPTNLCQYGAVTLTATYDYPYGDVCTSFQWRLNGNNIPGANLISYSATAAGNYTCVKTNGAGSVTSNVITVTANPIPATILATPAPIVCGDSIWLINNGMSGGYQWRLNGNNIPGATESTYHPTVSGNYSCIVTNPCGSFASNSIPVSINPPMADATITAAGPTVVCNGPVTLNANTGTGLSYQWYPHYDSIPATNSSYTPSTTGNYYVIETNANGCTRQSNTISVIIGEPVTHTIYPSSGSICNGNPVYLYTDYYFPYYSYQWTKDGSDISGATSYNYTAKQPGTYAVRVSASGGCSSASAGVIITHGCTTAATSKSPNSNELENFVLNEQKLAIAPNPASSQTQISFTTSKPRKILLNVFDIEGKLIKTIADRNFDAGAHQLLLDTKNFNAGIYILKMQAEASVFTKKLIVVK